MLEYAFLCEGAKRAVRSRRGMSAQACRNFLGRAQTLAENLDSIFAT